MLCRVYFPDGRATPSSEFTKLSITMKISHFLGVLICNTGHFIRYHAESIFLTHKKCKYLVIVTFRLLSHLGTKVQRKCMPTWMNTLKTCETFRVLLSLFAHLWVPVLCNRRDGNLGDVDTVDLYKCFLSRRIF